MTFPQASDVKTLEAGKKFTPRFNDDGLLPAIAREATTGEVLMVAYMNAEALQLTLTTKVAHFYSRSRRRIWKKGEESGNILVVQTILTDCDQDTVVLNVHVMGAGVACHTGEVSCFYREVVTDPTPPQREADGTVEFRLKPVSG
ncbi:MAG: phosphoribosyl-AMP cyclohydrolase [Pseudomonadota bacterium]